MKISHRFAASVLLAGLLCTATLHAEGVVYDDTAGADDGGEGIGGSFTELYNSFSSDATGGALTDLKLRLECTSECDGTLDLSLYSDSSTSPGSLIAQLGTVNDSDLLDTYALVDISLTNNPTLAPNTRYWVVFSGPTHDLWFYTNDISGIGVANEYQGDNVEGPLSNKSSGPYYMEVTEGASAAPEPAAWLLSLGAAGLFGLIRRRRT